MLTEEIDLKKWLVYLSFIYDDYDYDTGLSFKNLTREELLEKEPKTMVLVHRGD